MNTERATVTLIDGGHAFIADSYKPAEVDVWQVEYDYHNGPRCARCDDSWCEHCEPNRMEEACPLAGTALPGLDYVEGSPS